GMCRLRDGIEVFAVISLVALGWAMFAVRAVENASRAPVAAVAGPAPEPAPGPPRAVGSRHQRARRGIRRWASAPAKPAPAPLALDSYPLVIRHRLETPPAPIPQADAAPMPALVALALSLGGPDGGHDQVDQLTRSYDREVRANAFQFEQLRFNPWLAPQG